MKNTCLIIMAMVFACTVSLAMAQQGQEPAPAEIQTRLGTLSYEAGFPTTETERKLYDEIDYQRAVMAY